MTESTQIFTQQIDPLIENTANHIFKQYTHFEETSALEHGQWSNTLWQALQDSGLTTVDLPETLNGSGAHPLDAFNVIRLAGYHAAPVPIADYYIASKIYQSIGAALPHDLVTVAPPKHAQSIKVTHTENHIILDGTLKRTPWARYASTLLIPIEIKNKTCILKDDLQLLYFRSYKKPLFWYKFKLSKNGNKKLFLGLQSLDLCPPTILKYLLHWLEKRVN